VSPIQLITPWWHGANGDHLYWYCPDRHGEIATNAIRLAGKNDLGPITVHGLHPYAGEVCNWCLDRYISTIPHTEGDPIESLPVGKLAMLTAPRALGSPFGVRIR
jgi:hypothetical protein